MITRILATILAVIHLATVRGDDVDRNDSIYLLGTWASQSNSVFTGSHFFDPIHDVFQDISLPGLSLSFTEDGFFEHAAYEIIATRRGADTVDKCAERRLIYQHGTYEILPNRTLILSPWVEDGRIEVTIPCIGGEGPDIEDVQYYYFDETLVFDSWTIGVDNISGRYCLQLVKRVPFGHHNNNNNGLENLPPLFLAFNPPMMLPTVKMRPHAFPVETATTPEIVDIAGDTIKDRMGIASLVDIFWRSYSWIMKRVGIIDVYAIVGGTLLLVGTLGSLYM